MTALANFEINIKACDQLLAMYSELRRSRGIGSRGSLGQKNQDLIWLPRSTVVAAISALDSYVHDVIYEQVPIVLTSSTEIPASLATVMAAVIPIKKPEDFQAARTVLASHNTLHELFGAFRRTKLEFASYQAPDKVIAAYSLIGKADVFDKVSDLWQGPDSSPEDIKDTLAKYVIRRNKIAHEADLEHSGTPRPMQSTYAAGCKTFVENLVIRLDKIVYPDSPS
jgi:hypothetical protein